MTSEQGIVASTPPGFVLGSPIGRGASSVVWEATQSSTGRAVALKILDVDLRDADARRRFERERESLSALSNHPHIVTLYDAGLYDDRPWLALELCTGGSYADRISDGGPLDIDQAMDVLTAMAQALLVAHSANVLHCDIKPANIMIGEFGPALGDFGVARFAIGAHTRTAAGGYSLDHVAPELLDNKPPTVATDVYSLGTTMWELLSGRPPFRRTDDTSTAAIMRRVLLEDLPELPDPTVPAAISALLQEMTAKDPSRRPASMSAVIERVNALADGSQPMPAIPLQMPPHESDDLSATLIGGRHWPRHHTGPDTDENPPSTPASAEQLDDHDSSPKLVV